MTRGGYSTTIVVLIMAIITFGSGHAQDRESDKKARPNILVIIADDLGWNDVGYNGSFIQTPNIDKLARSGVRLDHHYVLPTCTPTRVALMTGRYPSRYGILGPDYGEVIYRGEPTLASLLAGDGYFTAIAGKWHMGSPPNTPLKYGFRSSYGYLDGQVDPHTHEYKTGPNSWHRNDKFLVEEGHATDLITDEAIRIIDRGRRHPFLLYVAYSVPHYPLDEPAKWTALYDSLNLYPSRKLFAASVTHMDAGIGRILGALDRTGQRANTIILFMSDNGGQESWHNTEEYRGKYAQRPHHVLGNNYPLRGWKGDVYEGGIRVPAVVSWPGHLRPGTGSFPMHVVDWLPTLCAVTGTDIGQHSPDGHNVWPQLSGDSTRSAARQFYWKTPSMAAVRDGDWKLIVSGDSSTAPQLFDLRNDFREMNDLSRKYPTKKDELLELLEAFRRNDRQKR